MRVCKPFAAPLTQADRAPARGPCGSGSASHPYRARGRSAEIRRDWRSWELASQRKRSFGNSRYTEPTQALRYSVLLQSADTWLPPTICTRKRGCGRLSPQKVPNLREQCHLKIDLPIPTDQLPGDKKDNNDYEQSDQCACDVVHVTPKLTVNITPRNSALPCTSGMSSIPKTDSRLFFPASRYVGPYDCRI